MEVLCLLVNSADFVSYFSEEDRKWFMEAMQAQTVDVVRRMKEITLVMQTPEQVLEAQGVTPGDIEGILDSQSFIHHSIV